MRQSMDDLAFEKLMLISQGHVAFQCLAVGLKWKLFDFLYENRGVERKSIARHFKIDVEPCKILLRALISLDLIRVENGLYSVDERFRYFLTGETGKRLGFILGWQEYIVYPAIVDFEESLKANSNIGLRNFEGEATNLYERLSSNPGLLNVFQKAMTGLSEMANLQFIEKIDLSGSKKVIDFGGGSGTNLKAILKKFPHLKGVIYDFDDVCGMADANIQAWNLENSLETHVGNLHLDSFPEGCDTLLFCHMFTIWSLEKIKRLLQKCWNYLPSGGKVIVFNMISNSDEKGPIACALGSPYFLTIAEGEGGLHTQREYEEVFSTAGFGQVNFLRDLPFNHGIIIATK